MLKLLPFLEIFISFAFASERSCGVGKQLKPVNDKNFPILGRNIKFLKNTSFGIYPNSTDFHNNGKTVIIKYNYKSQQYPSLEKGPYGNDIYRLEFMYFNWLKQSQVLEGTLPVELHVVFRNTKYETFEKAQVMNFGLTVWSFKYTTNFDSNEQVFTLAIFELLKAVKEPNTKTVLSDPMMTISALSEITAFSRDYYLYQGRLTSLLHACSGDVIWLEFPKPIHMYPESYENIKRLKSFNNTPLMKQFHESTPPDGPIFQNQDGTEDNDLSEIEFDYFNATSEDPDNGSNGKNINWIFIIITSSVFGNF